MLNLWLKSIVFTGNILHQPNKNVSHDLSIDIHITFIYNLHEFELTLYI